ncbi:SLAP domain-containing protein [Lactobacillus helveticus]|uniref:SLAP domain-containing protein n=1 Tax=Lactobacillus helveticus TaxID=1587 RepID=UPI001567BD1B|nr:SLAP domain-containing protein [Lactobacillus helveticus]
MVKKGFYNRETGEFTVTGRVNPDKVVKLVAITQSNSENDKQNLVTFDKASNFKFKFRAPIKAGEKAVKYIYTTKDGNKVSGLFIWEMDEEEPTLDLEIPSVTNQPVLHISGIANDNEDSYRVFVDGDNVFTQRSSGNNVNYYPESDQSMNPYGPYTINYDINLDDNNGKPTDHIITVEVDDKLGNVTQKKFNVHFDPNYTGQSEFIPGKNIPSPSEEPKVDQPVVPHANETTNNTDNLDNAITLTLTHNAFVYDANGNVVITDGKNTLLEKGNTISAWHKGQITTLAGKKYV